MAFRNSEDAKRTLGEITYFIRPQIQAGGETYDRFAIQTHFVERGENYVELVKKYVLPFYKEGDILSISEKIIAMCQNNVVEMKDVKAGWWAHKLAGLANHSSAGIGLHEPHKMQVAINLIGLPRILFACVCHVFGKLVGKKGVFYKIAGTDVAGIDGFWEDSSFTPYKTLAILNPRDPSGVCAEIGRETGVVCYIVDANDLSREILGVPPVKPVSDEVFIEMIDDNPAGQSDERTPFILIRKA